jgi:hypothetical protein
MELKKIYYRVGIHKLMESLFNTFVIYSSLKLQINNPLGVLLDKYQILLIDRVPNNTWRFHVTTL